MARLHREARAAATPWLRERYSDDETVWFFRENVLREADVRGVRRGGSLVAFIAVRDDWIDHLYVAPSEQRRGHGSALLAIALARAAEMRLWTFQRNARARRFYEARGFTCVALTDGSRNEEREPDALYAWRRPA